MKSSELSKMLRDELGIGVQAFANEAMLTRQAVCGMHKRGGKSRHQLNLMIDGLKYRSQTRKEETGEK